jgi:hypothetical protein
LCCKKIIHRQSEEPNIERKNREKNAYLVSISSNTFIIHGSTNSFIEVDGGRQQGVHGSTEARDVLDQGGRGITPVGGYGGYSLSGHGRSSG